MQTSEGRRIKRHLLIKSSSVRFVENEELDNLKKIQLIKDYIDDKKVEIEKHNLQNHLIAK